MRTQAIILTLLVIISGFISKGISAVEVEVNELQDSLVDAVIINKGIQTDQDLDRKRKPGKKGKKGKKWKKGKGKGTGGKKPKPGLENFCTKPACITTMPTLPPLTFTFLTEFERIWDDHGTITGYYDGSIWQPTSIPNYCLLGDVAVGGYKKPAQTLAVLWQEDSVAMIRPSNFTEIWNDKGSGAILNCAVYKMNAPNGYRCLGGVAMGQYTIKPSVTDYCCIKNEYTVHGKFVFIYNDKDTGANENLTLWEVKQKKEGAPGIPGYNFFPVPNYNNKYATNYTDAFLLKN